MVHDARAIPTMLTLSNISEGRRLVVFGPYTALLGKAFSSS
jgi:hypothetical protein